MIGSIDTAKEYLTTRYRTPSEIEGLDEYWNKYPCTIWTVLLGSPLNNGTFIVQTKEVQMASMSKNISNGHMIS